MAERGVRLCGVVCDGRTRLCVLEDDGPHAVADGDDLAELIAGRPEAETLEDLVAGWSVGREPVADPDAIDDRLGPPLRPPEVWAAGVTYHRSRDARRHESDSEQDAYSRVYEAERPELFLKATGWRITGPRDPVGLRSDSSWQVPEAELGLMLGGRGRILGYLLGNDQTSRDIEGANTLYLPQAKIFAGSCALGPVLASTAAVDPLEGLVIELRVRRGEVVVWEDTSSLERLRRDPAELVDYLRRDNPIRPGTVLLTGTGIVPPEDFTLERGDVVEISADGLGELRNRCEPASALIGAAGAE